MSELYGYMDDGDVLNGGMEEIAKVVGHSDWGEIGGQLSDQEDLQDALDKKADKARVDILEKLTLGQVWDYDPYDETVYQQTVPAGGHGVEMESVGGRSVVWNQLAPSFTAELISTGTSSKSVSFAEGAKVIAGHKYLISALIETDTNYGVYVYTRVNGTNKDTLRAQFQNGGRLYVIATSLYSAESIGTKQAVEGNLWLYLAIPTTGEHYVNASDHRIIDLTLLFGSGNEPTSTSDPRIAWIEAYAEEHPEYNAGEVVHGKVESVDEVGMNIIDLSDIKTFSNWKTDIATTASATNGVVTETNNKGYLLPCLPNVTYTISKPTSYTDHYLYLCKVDSNKVGTRIAYLTADRNVNNTYTFSIATGEKAFLRSGSTTDQGMFENSFGTIEWIQLERGSTATTYSPYHHTTYPIPAEVQALEGYGWSAGSVCNEVDFKRKKFIKRVGRVDMGEQSWTYSVGLHMFYVFISNGKTEATGAGTTDAVCPRYTSFVGLAADLPDKHYRYGGKWYSQSVIGELIINDSAYTNATAFKTAMSGTYFYYELATPIETDISAYITDEWQTIETEPNGSITFTNDNLLPVPIKDRFKVKLTEALA